MSLKKRIISVSRELTELNIGFHERKRLIRNSFSFPGRIYSYPYLLKSSIEEAKEKNIEGEMAYSFIIKDMKEREQKFYPTNDLYQYQIQDIDF